MREIYIPQNRKELKSLAGEMVVITHNWKDNIIEYPRFEVYYGLDGNTHEFISQVSLFDKQSSRNRVSYRPMISSDWISDEHLRFTPKGILFQGSHSSGSSDGSFGPTRSREYEERRRFLRKHNHWRTPDK